MIAFFALIGAWFVLPATTPRVRTDPVTTRPAVEAMQTAA